MLTISYIDNVTTIKTVRLFARKILFSSRAYIFDDILIDSGLPGDHGMIEAAGKVSKVLITHPHVDHFGGASEFEKEGVPVYVHESGIERMIVPRSQFMLRLLVGRPKPVRALKCPERIESENMVIDAYPTPGHCDDHLCFHVPEKDILFTGDLVLGGKLSWVSDEVRIWDAIKSLRFLRSLNAEILFPGHGEPFKNLDSLLSEKIEAYEQMGNKIIQLYEKGNSPEMIRDKLLGKEELMARMSRGKLSKLNLINSFLESYL